jgi:uncharacterized protein (UPF0332 family)
MSEHSGSGSLPPEFGVTLLDEAFRIWIEPEIAKRGLKTTRTEVSKALVVMSPAESPKVLINDEVQLIATFRAAGPIEKGQVVTLADVAGVESVHPANVDPNAGWLALVRIGDEMAISFDFRRNRRTAELLVEKASEFADAAAKSLENLHLGPAIENAFAALELSVKAEMYLLDDSPTQVHHKRIAWWAEWVRLGNAPSGSDAALEGLYRQRGASRYGDGVITMTQEEVEEALQSVRAVIEQAQLRVESSNGPNES